MNGPHVAAVTTAAALAAALEQALAQQQAPPPRATPRVDVTAASAGNGLAKLVLALIKLLHELLERQALRRIDAGSLNDDEIERLGLALMRQAEEIERLAGQFGFTDADLNLDLGPLGRLF
ncbi:gas vesicle protein GvpK [Burkholderia sp. ABCPW 14]|uniref:Gas vesicle protein GvpK n=1 Tax=Burkholderia mayonis TaxID=1385591 RepID=A0A1B4FS16_9BURK|nr:gas vesicle protein K [Burkholderia mayonis]AOJ06477.1 gas vesicle protein GvpK [Burkholderia mayonis]KVD78855.1 gas vesicle protein GvpK [Burkholderia sp. ABCPW 14]KVE51578.1 gas vesicle protein GvpK [Burkholderia mayonis]